jgi:hypothetical protein
MGGAPDPPWQALLEGRDVIGMTLATRVPRLRAVVAAKRH